MKLLVAILGETDYGVALELQQSLLQLRQQGKIPDIMLLLQHPPTLTMGTRDNYASIIAPQAELTSQGVNLVKTNRGGDVTYHGPGQVVGYPIVHLRHHGGSIKSYINKIEETFIQLLRLEYGILAGRQAKHPGVWIGDDKITAIGCAVKRWVTMHGFAFNVNTNLAHYQWIIPCGITDKGVTSLQKQLGQQLGLAKVHQQIIKHFCATLNYLPTLISLQELHHILERKCHE